MSKYLVFVISRDKDNLTLDLYVTGKRPHTKMLNSIPNNWNKVGTFEFNINNEEIKKLHAGEDIYIYYNDNGIYQNINPDSKFDNVERFIWMLNRNIESLFRFHDGTKDYRDFVVSYDPDKNKFYIFYENVELTPNDFAKLSDAIESAADILKLSINKTFYDDFCEIELYS